MKVKELVAKLLVCDQEANVTDSQGTEIVQVLRNTALREVELIEEDPVPDERLKSGWEIVS